MLQRIHYGATTWRSQARAVRVARRTIVTLAQSPDDRSATARPVYRGVYGEWRVTDRDVAEVWLYRISISVVALSALGCSAYEAGLVDVNPDALTLAGITGLGLALQLIHVYVTPLKRLLQIFWALGVGGYVWVATQAPDASTYASTLDLILAQPSQTLWVGPLGAAMTGIVFKEGLCYGKGEAGGLCLAIPALFLCHLFGLDERVPAVGYVLDATVCGLLAIFAARKYTQNLEDDIGDGSVFAFQGMSEEEQLEVLRRLDSRSELE